MSLFVSCSEETAARGRGIDFDADATASFPEAPSDAAGTSSGVGIESISMWDSDVSSFISSFAVLSASPGTLFIVAGTDVTCVEAAV